MWKCRAFIVSEPPSPKTFQKTPIIVTGRPGSWGAPI